MKNLKLADLENAVELRNALEELSSLVAYALTHSVSVLPQEGKLWRALAVSKAALESK